MTGYNANDMKTKAADHIGDANKMVPAAAQEAVAWQVGDDFYTSESLAIEGIQQWGPSGSIAIPLYAAPVTAAPSAEAVELTVCCGREECGGECGNEWLGTERVRKAATPAAPGIDLEQFRPAVCAMGLYAEEPGDVDEAKRLLALIDASPKGGSDAPDMFWNDADPERAFDSIIELVSQEWSNGSVVEGDVMEIQQAIRLPNIKVRVVESEDDGVDYEQLQATSAEVKEERCESGSPDCGPVEHWDSEAVPLCARCWKELTTSHGAGVSGD